MSIFVALGLYFTGKSIEGWLVRNTEEPKVIYMSTDTNVENPSCVPECCRHYKESNSSTHTTLRNTCVEIVTIGFKTMIYGLSIGTAIHYFTSPKICEFIKDSSEGKKGWTERKIYVTF